MSEHIPATINFDNLPEDQQNIINRTIEDIREIFEESATSTYEKVGELIILNLFNNDHALASEINNSTSMNSKSKLFQHLETEIKNRSKKRTLPKKTWLYNSVNLVLDKKRIENTAARDQYLQLKISHKIELLSIKDMDQKIKMIQKIHNENSSVRKSREAIGKSKSYGLLSYIKDPRKITEVNDIKLVGGKKKEEAIEEGNKTIKSLHDEIEEKQLALENLEKLVNRLREYNPPRGRQKSK